MRWPISVVFARVNQPRFAFESIEAPLSRDATTASVTPTLGVLDRGALRDADGIGLRSRDTAPRCERRAGGWFKERRYSNEP